MVPKVNPRKTCIDTTLGEIPYPSKIQTGLDQMDDFLAWPVYRDLCAEDPETGRWFLATFALTVGLTEAFEKENQRKRRCPFWFNWTNLMHYYGCKGDYRRAQIAFYFGSLYESAMAGFPEASEEIWDAFARSEPVPFRPTRRILSLEESQNSWNVYDKIKMCGTNTTPGLELYLGIKAYDTRVDHCIRGGLIPDAMETLKPLFDWLDTELTPEKIREYKKTTRKHRVLEPNLNPITYLSALRHWFEGRKDPARAEYHAREAIKGFVQCTQDAYMIENNLLGCAPIRYLVYTFVLRIDLGVDLEPCRRYAKYFMPVLLSYPHIREKLLALGVEYSPFLGPQTTRKEAYDLYSIFLRRSYAYFKAHQ